MHKICIMFLFLQVYVDTLVKKAYENWDQVIQYDGKSLLNFKQNKRSTRTEFQTGPISYSDASDHQLQVPRLTNSVPSEQPPLDPALPIGGKHCCLHEYSMFHIWPHKLYF